MIMNQGVWSVVDAFLIFEALVCDVGKHFDAISGTRIKDFSGFSSMAVDKFTVLALQAVVCDFAVFDFRVGFEE